VSSPQAAVPPLAGVSLRTVAREWGRIGCIGFDGPPAHIALFRELCVTRREWLTDDQFERAIAATNILPGPLRAAAAVDKDPDISLRVRYGGGYRRGAFGV
jgi:hypothetical protein